MRNVNWEQSKVNKIASLVNQQFYRTSCRKGKRGSLVSKGNILSKLLLAVIKHGEGTFMKPVSLFIKLFIQGTGKRLTSKIIIFLPAWPIYL